MVAKLTSQRKMSIKKRVPKTKRSRKDSLVAVSLAAKMTTKKAPLHFSGIIKSLKDSLALMTKSAAQILPSSMR